ncbi:MAG: Rpn family recombination-promoting nuclease/putative transposase [Saprospiraceae bacterium]|nr:Rpn family recombination-promoting nuclease/putative transposase [Saprospiraceae bacterium]
MAMNSSNLVRFDWAIKRLLRDKANYVVLEGFLSVLLEEEVKIRQILSSQGNKETNDDKYNDVDILVENTKRELIIIEVQNTKEYDYFHRILYGTSKVISEYIKEGRPYAEVKKVISITIAYFDLGQGEDYVYHGTTSFRGIHKGDLLTLSEKQVEIYNKEKVSEIYPEYWIIKAGIFDEEKVNDKLDEWVFFFKTGEVKDEFSAPGLSEAKVKLNKLKLKPKDRKEYEAYLERLRRLASSQHTQMADAQDLIKQGEENKEIEAVLGFYEIGVSPENIAKALKISLSKVLQIIEDNKK